VRAVLRILVHVTVNDFLILRDSSLPRNRIQYRTKYYMPYKKVPSLQIVSLRTNTATAVANIIFAAVNGHENCRTNNGGQGKAILKGHKLRLYDDRSISH